MPNRELQKVLSGNRITLPAAYMALSKLHAGDIVIVEWDKSAQAVIQPGEVKPKQVAK